MNADKKEPQIVKKDLKMEPTTPGNQRGGRGGNFAPRGMNRGGRGGHGGFNNPQGPKRESPAPGASRGNVVFIMNGEFNLLTGKNITKTFSTAVNRSCANWCSLSIFGFSTSHLFLPKPLKSINLKQNSFLNEG